MPLTYQQALDYIHNFDDPYLAALRDHGKQTWGLDGVRALLARLGDPHLAYPTIHVAGTKGKGSTCAFIARGLMESSLKTGLYISPHLQDWRERIQINGAPIGKAALARLVEDAQPHLEGAPLSTFEVATALALWHFARERCDAAVIEVGLGGRLDATSVVDPIVAVITSLSLDHTQLLGNTLAEIAAEKAAIIKPRTPVVSAPQEPEALAVVETRAQAQGSRLVLVGRDWHYEVIKAAWEGADALIGGDGGMQNYHVGLPGLFQVENATVALAALHEVRQAGLPVTEAGCSAGLAQIHWPGRMERVSRQPTVVLDGAHNPYSVRRLVESLELLLEEEGRTVRPTFVFGCMADKDIAGMLEALLPAARRVILTQANMARAAAPPDLLARALEVADRARDSGAAWLTYLDLSTAPTVAEALRAALTALGSDDVLCVTGSLAVVGEARSILIGEEIKEEI